MKQITSIEDFKSLSLFKNSKEKVQFTCESCGKEAEKSAHSLWQRPYLLCKKCLLNKARVELAGSLDEFWKRRDEQSKKTLLEKYGVENAYLIEDTYKKGPQFVEGDKWIDLHDRKSSRQESRHQCAIKNNVIIVYDISIYERFYREQMSEKKESTLEKSCLETTSTRSHMK